MSDEVRFERKPAKKGPKKTFAQSFFPQKGDSSSEIINKIIVLISIVVLIVCAVLLGDYFYQMYEAKQNHNTLKVIYQQAQLQQSQSSQDKTDDVPAESAGKGSEITFPFDSVVRKNDQFYLLVLRKEDD